MLHTYLGSCYNAEARGGPGSSVEEIEMDPIWADIIAAGLAGWALAQRQRELEAEAEAALVPVPIPIPIEEEG